MSGVVFIETVRRHVQNVAYLVLLLVLAIVALIVGGSGGPAGLWVALASLIGIILGCQLIGPEFSSGTLQLVLAKPINRATSLLSRYAGVLAAVAIVFIVPMLFDLGGRLFVDNQSFAAGMIAAPLNNAISFVMAVALLALFGSMSRSYINVAIYYALEVIFFLANGVLARKYPSVRTALANVTRNIFPQAPEEFDWRWMVMVLSNASVVLLLACLVFRKREVPYGAD